MVVEQARCRTCSTIGFGQWQSLLKPFQGLYYGLDGWFLVDVMDVYVADLALFVHDEYGPLGDAFLAKHSVLDGNMAMRPEVAQNGVRQSSQRSAPSVN